MKATIESEGKQVEGNIRAIVRLIRPAVEKAEGYTKNEADLLANAVKENVRSVVAAIAANSPIIAGHVKEGKVKVVGAYYSIKEGTVAIL